jgi:hypothetical protein
MSRRCPSPDQGLFRFIWADDDQVEDDPPPRSPPAPLRTRVKGGHRMLWGDVAVYARPSHRHPRGPDSVG